MLDIDQIILGEGKSPYKDWNVLAAVWNPLYKKPADVKPLTLKSIRYMDLLIVQSRVTDEIVVVKNRLGEDGRCTLAQALKLQHNAVRKDLQ